MKPTLFILAAGMGSRYGGLKQFDGVSPCSETIMDYSFYDALQAGFGKIVFVIRHFFEKDFREKVAAKYESLGPVGIVFQELDNLPEGFTLNPEREKPWGTDHALLMGKDVINELFGIINVYIWPPQSGARPYDVYNPEALDIYWKYLNKGIFSYIGDDGWWLDSTEPDHINQKKSDYDLPTYLGSYHSLKNAYSMMHNSGIAMHQKAQAKDKPVVILTRSGFIGQQCFGSNTWSGDVHSTWDMLEKQIPAALNLQ